ncbi:MAG: LLM class F420-dependent oxidoreductase [Chloroflexi bacterium]|nr:MAG: LLM class F420-dependent oxidoreductase [Chloroflexota bacterium]
MARFKVGVQLHPQHTTIDQIREAWQTFDQLGVDSIWIWDHFFPLSGDPKGRHFEGLTLLPVMAVDTQHAQFGVMVTCNSYRNPDLLADMARTVDHLGNGRFILGIGSGWYERDYREYGYEFGTVGSRLRDLGQALPRIKARLKKLNPPPKGKLPILIGGGGVKVTLRLVAEYADMWNSFGPPANYQRLNGVLNDWCRKVGRDPATIERTVSVTGGIGIDDPDAYLRAGAQHLIVELDPPYPTQGIERLLAEARQPAASKKA